MKKKKFLALLLTGAMALAALTGCSSGTETTEESTGGDASAESGDGAYKIALIQQHQTNAFQIGVTEGAQAKADELGVELNILSADQDAAKQISQIEQCVSEGYDAILFEPVDPDGLRDAAKAAADAGVIMINIVSACTDWESAGISAVSCGDNVKAGENEMQHVADLLGGKGANLAEMTNLGMPVPQGFTISTEACTKYYEDDRNINDEIKALGKENFFHADYEATLVDTYGTDYEDSLVVEGGETSAQ